MVKSGLEGKEKRWREEIDEVGKKEREDLKSAAAQANNRNRGRSCLPPRQRRPGRDLLRSLLSEFCFSFPADPPSLIGSAGMGFSASVLRCSTLLSNVARPMVLRSSPARCWRSDRARTHLRSRIKLSINPLPKCKPKPAALQLGR
ncbi:hypothetical protein BDW71DRAFT_62581 [Aspergillus fruticulosus]